MSKPVASRARLITVGVALASVSTSLLALPPSALAAMFVDRAELDPDEGLRVEGEDAVPNAVVWVTSAESSASSPADEDGRFRVLAANFQSSNCQATVTDGATSVQVSLDECTPTPPTTIPPPTTAPTTTTVPTTTTTTNDHDDDNDHNYNGATDNDDDITDDDNDATDDDNDHNDDHDDDHDDDTAAADAGDVHRSPRRRAAPLLRRGDQHRGRRLGGDRDRRRWCCPGDLPKKGVHRGDHGVQPGERGRHVQRDRHGSAGYDHQPRSVRAVGNRLLERSTYWRASGTGELTADGVSVPFSFTTPSLGRSIDLTGQNVESTTISVSISMSAGRSGNQPRVTNPPGSASISVTSARIIVEYA